MSDSVDLLLEPVVKLGTAVVERALMDLTIPLVSRGTTKNPNKNKRHRVSAEKFFDPARPYWFDFWCAAGNLDRDSVREKVKEMRDAGKS